MSKEPSKDFRQAVMDIIADAECNLDAPSEKQLTTDEFTDRILALCKEMLVRAEFEPDCYEPENCSCAEKFRQHLLKQLGEK